MSTKAPAFWLHSDYVVIDDSEHSECNWTTLTDLIENINTRLENLERSISCHQTDLYELRGLKNMAQDIITNNMRVK